ncbi:MAG TPA: biotin--[acetyl-CoA-carboxylase] ligase [Thermoplasmata archaeon]|nr:biotin--[acetyl-CoA-carboxylase] ligase [Thermoplasmata archaeon]
MHVVREFYEVIPSTQPRARALAAAGAPAGSRVVAARQTDGRGRLDHRWASPPGGLYLSVIVRAPRAAETLLPLAIGAELALEVRRRWSVEVRLKWPNDLWVEADGVGPRKLGGVLIDEFPGSDGHRVAVVGIGINVARPVEGYPAGMRVAPVALSELTSDPPAVGEVEEAAVAAALRASVALEGPGGSDAELRTVRALLYGVGRIGAVDGETRGRIRSVADDGALLLEVEGTLVPFRAGDLTMEAS